MINIAELLNGVHERMKLWTPLLFSLILVCLFSSCGDYHYSDGGVITDIYKRRGDNGHIYYCYRIHCQETWAGLNTDFYLLSDSIYQIGDWVEIK